MTLRRRGDHWVMMVSRTEVTDGSCVLAQDPRRAISGRPFLSLVSTPVSHYHCSLGWKGARASGSDTQEESP
ncbi:hypothetical protein Celaphus_00012757, partial [Cervus elaphus hippelaphus]